MKRVVLFASSAFVAFAAYSAAIGARMVGVCGVGEEPKPYDAEIEYIHANGNEYIDLDFRATNISGCEIKVLLDPNVAQDAYVFGTRSSKDRFSLNISTEYPTYYNGLYYGFGSMSQISSKPNRSSIITGSVLTIKMNYLQSRICECAGYVVNCNTISEQVPTSYLFAENRNGTVAAKTKGSIYYFKITSGDELAVDLIPVRVGQVGYMYDKISRRLFGNIGTGAFTLGPDVN